MTARKLVSEMEVKSISGGTATAEGNFSFSLQMFLTPLKTTLVIIVTTAIMINVC